MKQQLNFKRPVVGISQWLAKPGQARENLDAAFELLDQLDPACNVAVLPEFWLCGYDPTSFAEDVRKTAVTLDAAVVHSLCKWASDRGIYLVPGSLPEFDQGKYFNTTLLIGPDGTIVGRHRKAHLWGIESEAMSPGDAITVCEATALGNVGLSICFDGDFPEVARQMRSAGARLVIHPCAYYHPYEKWWDTIYPAHALSNGQWWVMSNQAGSHDSISFFGKSQVISPAGDIVASAAQADPGTTPPAENLVVELASDAFEAEIEDAGVLYSQRRNLPTKAFSASKI